MQKPKPSAKLLSSALISLAGIATSGCADWGTVTGTAKQVCEQWRPIRPSRADKLTDGTTKQLAGNNAANEAWCGERKVASQ